MQIRSRSEEIRRIYTLGAVLFVLVAIALNLVALWRGFFDEVRASLELMWCSQSLLFLRYELPGWRDEKEHFLVPLVFAIDGVVMVSAGFLSLLFGDYVLGILVILFTGLLTAFSVDHYFKLKVARVDKGGLF